MDEKRIEEIKEQYRSGEVDIGEAGILLLSAGVPADEIVPMLQSVKKEDQ